MEGNQDESGERVHSSCSSRTNDLFKDPEISPRVGDEYQVELPPLMTNDELLQLMENPVHLGLPIPVMWVLSDSESREENHITVNSEDANGRVETLSPTLDVGEENAEDSMEIDLVSPKQETMSLDRVYEGCLPVPGLLGEAWEDIERDSFLLGLYIFGKNFCLVKKFVGSKGMGEILSYYHGKFYKSSEYNKWLEFRKKRKKRRSYGERIFTSWRQQELFSRLSSHVSEECKTRLIEASRIFGAGKMPVEKYVLSLKEMVGLKLLVQAIAIGKGKQELIGMPMEHAKTNLSFPVRPEIPSSKSCSSLTVDEIVKFLTGDIRLSKARSNDLFWDAVWPRLSDRGWRTEEPKNYISLSSKKSWVYLIPGVKKFSRRKLVKGTHYFDSVTDVLNKVALEPKLLELDEEQSGPGPQAEQGTDGFSSRERHSYLQPLVSQEQVKFTIVDTSLVCGKESEKVIELRTLPSDPVAISTPPAVSEGIEQNNVKESVDTPSCEAGMVLNTHSINGPDPMMSETDKHEDQNQPMMPMKINVQSSRSNDLDKHELTPCNSKGGSTKGFKDICNDNKGGSEATEECNPVEKNQETWIDLNVPRTPQFSDGNEPLLKKSPERSQQQQQLQPELLNPPSGIMNGQRQSTRNRPLTTKALEALACGYLSPKKKRKSGESMPKPPRRVRGKTALLTSCGVSIGDESTLHKMEKGIDGVFNGSSHMRTKRVQLYESFFKKIVGLGGGFSSPLLQKPGPLEVRQRFGFELDSSAMNDMIMEGGDQGHGYMENMEQEDISNSGFVQGRNDMGRAQQAHKCFVSFN